MYRKLVLAYLTSSLLLNAPSVFAHSGGTDESGCHAGTQPYHCHNDSNASSFDGGEVVVAAVVLAVVAACWIKQKQKRDDRDTLDSDQEPTGLYRPTLTLEPKTETVLVGVEYHF